VLLYKVRPRPYKKKNKKNTKNNSAKKRGKPCVIYHAFPLLASVDRDVARTDKCTGTGGRTSGRTDRKTDSRTNGQPDGQWSSRVAGKTAGMMASQPQALQQRNWVPQLACIGGIP